ncbi:MAG: lipoate--protein ligase family protein [Aggregatilineales bacterium]
MSETWRLLVDPPDQPGNGDGAWNMACDQAILSAVGAGELLPTLRLYGWQPACLSLGYAQRSAEFAPERLKDRGWNVVRRLSGGRAILHVDELTYSVTLPAAHPLAAGSVLDSYRRLSGALMAAIQTLGVEVESLPRDRGQQGLPGPVCFELPSDYEITAGSKKLIGSAQVRAMGGVLQHGALPLIGDVARIADGLHFEGEGEREAAKINVRQRATTLSTAAGRVISWNEATNALINAFAACFAISLMPLPRSDAEQSRAETLRQERYSADSWTLRR